MQSTNENPIMTYAKRLFGVLFGIILLLFSVLGFLIPSGMALNCSRESETCDFITRFTFRESQVTSFSFSEFIDAQAVFTHTVKHSALYGVEVKTQLGTITVADFSKEEAEKGALRLKAYIQKPSSNAFNIDSKEDLVHILGIFACLFAAICAFAVSIFNLPLRRTATASKQVS